MSETEKYEKMKSLIENKVRESNTLDSKINWIDTYLDLCESDIDSDLVSSTKREIWELYLDKGDSMYDYDLPEEFMEKYKDKLDWVRISKTQDLSSEFIFQNKDLINFTYLSVSNYFKLNDNDIKDLIDDCDDNNNDYSKKTKFAINWSTISLREDLSIDFIRKFKDYLVWSYLSVNCDFTEDQLVEFFDYIDWEKAVMCQNYSDDFKEKYNLDEYIDSIKENGSNKFEERERIYEKISSEVESAREYASERGYDVRNTNNSNNVNGDID